MVTFAAYLPPDASCWNSASVLHEEACCKCLSCYWQPVHPISDKFTYQINFRFDIVCFKILNVCSFCRCWLLWLLLVGRWTGFFWSVGGVWDISCLLLCASCLRHPS